MEADLQINCFKHATERVQRVSTQLNSNSHVFCLECLLENQQNPSEILSISEFLTIADDFYKNTSHNLNTTNLKPPPEYISALNEQNQVLDNLKEHTQQEKSKINEFFDQIKETFIQALEEQRKEHLAELDQQLARLQYWHVFFEKKLRMTYSNTTDFNNILNSEAPLMQKLHTVKDPLQFEAYIRSIKEDLNEEILRINKSKPFDQDKKFKLNSLYKKLTEYQNTKPTYNISEDFDDLQQKLEANIQDLLDSTLSFKNSIPDALDDCNCPDSQIIDASHYRMLTQWLPHDSKYQNLKLLYRGSRDGMSAKAFHEKCDQIGPTVTLIRCRFYNSTKKSIIGGFLDKDWSSNDEFIASDEAFLFSLTAKVKCPQRSRKKKNEESAYGKADLGPTFGSGYELRVSENFRENCVESCDYENSDLLIDRKNQEPIRSFENHKSWGMNYFAIKEIEVYTFK